MYYEHVVPNPILKFNNDSHVNVLIMYTLMYIHVCTVLQDTFNKIVSPHNILSFSEGELVSKVHVQNPVFDHVPPDLITLFISNM